MQEVQTLSRFGVPPTTVRTDWMFGFQRRRVRRCECEIELPKPGPLPQTSQLAATGTPLSTVMAVRRPIVRVVRDDRASDAAIYRQPDKNSRKAMPGPNRHRSGRRGSLAKTDRRAGYSARRGGRLGGAWRCRTRPRLLPYGPSGAG